MKTEEMKETLLYRSVSVKTRLSVHQLPLHSRGHAKNSPLKRRKSLTGPHFEASKSKTLTIKKSQNLHIIEEKQLQLNFPFLKRNKNHDEELNKGQEPESQKQQKLPSINKAKVLAFEKHAQRPRKDYEQKIIKKPKMLQFLNRIKHASSDLESNQLQEIDEQNQQGDKNVVNIHNLALGSQADLGNYQYHHNYSKMLAKFQEIERRNKVNTNILQRKLYFESPHELIARKLKLSQFQTSNPEKTNSPKLMLEHKKEKKDQKEKKETSNKTPAIKDELYVRGWETELDFQHNFPWL